MPETMLSLAPFSLTKLTAPFGQQGTITGGIAYADRSLKTGGFTPAETGAEYCSVLADFAEPNLTGSEFFIGPNLTPWNQNEKINSGGTYHSTSLNASVSLSDTGAAGYSTLDTASGTLNIDCISTAAAGVTYVCGVMLPFFDDSASQRWKNWQNGAAGTGSGSPSFKIHKVRICDKL